MFYWRLSIYFWFFFYESQGRYWACPQDGSNQNGSGQYVSDFRMFTVLGKQKLFLTYRLTFLAQCTRSAQNNLEWSVLFFRKTLVTG